jgi:hypothetical protein
MLLFKVLSTVTLPSSRLLDQVYDNRVSHPPDFIDVYFISHAYRHVVLDRPYLHTFTRPAQVRQARRTEQPHRRKTPTFHPPHYAAGMTCFFSPYTFQNPDRGIGTVRKLESADTIPVGELGCPGHADCIETTGGLVWAFHHVALCSKKKAYTKCKPSPWHYYASHLR